MRKQHSKYRNRKPSQQLVCQNATAEYLNLERISEAHTIYSGNVLRRKMYSSNTDPIVEKFNQITPKLLSADEKTICHDNQMRDVIQVQPCCDGQLEEKSVKPNSVQITSIDGFFNRKRGRPPKNRFVEVYKNQSPQAIFTSFKLDRQGSEREPTNLNVDFEQIDDEMETLQDVSHPESSTLVKKHAKEYMSRGGGHKLVPEQRRRNYMRGQDHTTVKIFTVKHGTHRQIQDYHQMEDAELANRAADKVSIIRAAGTFYPENITIGASHNTKSSALSSQAKPSKRSRGLQFQDAHGCSPIHEGAIDLRVSTDRQQSNQNAKEVNSDQAQMDATSLHNLAIQYLKQVFQFYQIQQELHKQNQPFECETSTTALRQLLPLQTFMEFSEMATDVVNVEAESEEDPCRVPTKSKKEDVPVGYAKFRHNENCGYLSCGYCERQTHFHCVRSGCPYSFCDKGRFVQHTARHERLDSLMGQDFIQYRANVNCGHCNCTFYNANRSQATTTSDIGQATAKKSSHFHCVKCEFVCSDTNKLIAHRRLHYRMEYIRMSGFRKVDNTRACDPCPYSLKHTHYHCLICNYSVMSRSQFATHKHENPKDTSETVMPNIS